MGVHHLLAHEEHAFIFLGGPVLLLPAAADAAMPPPPLPQAGCAALA